MLHALTEALEERLNFSTLYWSAGPVLAAAADQTAAVRLGLTTYLAGNNSTAVSKLIDGAGGWTAAGPADQGLASPGFGVTAGRLVIFGGSAGDPQNLTSLYDPTGNNTTDGPPMGTERAQLAYASDPGGKVFALGGYDLNRTPLASGEAFDGTAWSAIAPMPAPRVQAAAADDGNGHVFVIGGEAAIGGAPVSTVYEYTLATNTWSAVASLPTAVKDGSAVFCPDGNIYVVGGLTTGGGSPTGAVQIYNVASNTWSAGTALPQALSSTSAVVDGAGRLLVIGGDDSSGHAVGTTYVTQSLTSPLVAPTITSTPPAAAFTTAAYQYTPTATGNPAPTFSLVSGPVGMTVDPASGHVTWQPTVSQVGAQSVDLRASNPQGFVDQNFTILTKPENVGPTAPANVTVTAVTTGSITIKFTPSQDPFGVSGYIVYYRYGHSGRGGGITTVKLATHVGQTNSFTIGGLLPGKAYAQLWLVAYNSSGYVSGASNNFGATTYSPPSLYVPTPISAVAKHPLTFHVFGTGIPAPTYALLNAPAGVNFDPTTGTGTWTPTPAQTGTYTLTAKSTNAAGSVAKTFTITVTPDVPNLSYVINGYYPGIGVGQVGQPMTIQVHDSSNTPSTYAISGQPAGMKINPATGLISFTPTEAEAGTDTAVVKATNQYGSTTLNVSFTTYVSPAPTNVVAGNTTLLNPTLSWTKPAINSAAIAGYDVTLYYYNGPYYLSTTYDTHSPATSLTLSNLPVKGTNYFVYINSYDRFGHVGQSSAETGFYYNPNLPVISYTGTPNQVVVGKPLSLKITNTNTSLPVKFGIQNPPPNMSIDPLTGVVSFTPTAGDVGTTKVTFTATNAVGQVSETIPVTVYPFDAPAVTSATYTPGGKVTVAWKPPTQNTASVTSYLISVAYGNQGTSFTTPANQTSLSFTPPVVAGYTYVIFVYARDAAGRLGVASALTAVYVP